ncbi:hypothetical protein [Methylobacterium oryzae]|uniref:hypothetical protein n=1 Tax=Methylobacterium oryzae TaxID=334852 RepID=UPI001F21930E|nr:hypothetical protein [Methylobacterium oryzae]UIN36387.1 hypothetical protein LXM90_07790 [Methylobacterium oryzae]
MELAIAQVAQPVELPAMQHDHDNDNECQAIDRNASADQFLNRFASLDLDLQILKGAEGEDQEAYQKRADAMRRRGSFARGRARDIGRLLWHRHDGPCETDDAELWLATALPFVADAAELIGLSAYAEGLAWARTHCPGYVRRVGMLAVAEAIAEILERRDAAEKDRHETNRTWVRWLPDMSELVAALRPTWVEVTGLGLRGWRCIDRPDEQELKIRATMQKQERRRAEGVRPQSERTKTRDLTALATELGMSLRQVRRWDKAGTLEANVTKRRNVQNPSAPYTPLSSGLKLDIASNDNMASVREPLDDDDWRACFAYLGTILGVLHAEVPRYQERYPGLDILAVLPALDAEIAAMSDVEPPEADSILQELLELRYGSTAVAA